MTGYSVMEVLLCVSLAVVLTRLISLLQGGS